MNKMMMMMMVKKMETKKNILKYSTIRTLRYLIKKKMKMKKILMKMMRKWVA